ncbi:MAG: YIP1 family protein [Firmicutes bacterium]|nr:YIP1 family protein [Bacillota bacterium]
MEDIEFIWIFEGIKRMIKEPVKFFGEIAHRDINLIIPSVVLFFTGIMMGLTVYTRMLAKKASLEANHADITHNIERNLSIDRLESILYPLWVLLFWVGFTIVFAIVIGALTGWGDFKGIFNCTAFIIYPHCVSAFVILILSLTPLKSFIVVIQLLMTIWTLFLLVRIAESAGKLPPMNAWLAALIPSFFFFLIWYCYEGGFLTGLLLFR